MWHLLLLWEALVIYGQMHGNMRGQTQQMGVDDLLAFETLTTRKAAVEQLLLLSGSQCCSTGLTTPHAVAGKQVTATTHLSNGRLLSLYNKPHRQTETHQDGLTDTPRHAN